MTKRLYTVKEAAEYLGRSEQAIWGLVNKGKLPVVRLDKRVQFDVRVLDKIIEENTHGVNL